MLEIFVLAVLALPEPWGFAQQPHGHRRTGASGGDADGKVSIIVCVQEREALARGGGVFLRCGDL